MSTHDFFGAMDSPEGVVSHRGGGERSLMVSYCFRSAAVGGSTGLQVY